ncbi:MAG: hypothetical protein MJK10_19340 [Pseudomonadales bacterium]|nr:hypothetical protein [Pseudomonadales bacterium]NRA17402.1 hypothetical protein [Oceanospirillaceae bacterium]
MKQRINLLPIKPKRVRNWLGLKNLLTLLSVLFISCSLAGLGFWLDARNLQSQAVSFEVQNLSLQNNLMQLKSQQATRQVPRELEHELKQMRQQVLAMQQMLTLEDTLNSASRGGFSQTMTQLQNSMPDRAELHSFKIGSHTNLVYVRGSAATPQDLPLIIKNLRARHLLEKHDIEKLRMQRSGDSHSFEVSVTSGGQEQ